MARPDQLLHEIFADVAQIFGLSRPAGQCFGAIWRAAQAPCADDLVAGLGLSRSNVSTALKELRHWGLISIVRTPGDRKEYFSAPADPWELMRRVTAARHRQIIAPLLDRLLVAEGKTEDARLAALHAVLSRITEASEALSALEAAQFAKRIAVMTEDAQSKKKKKKG